MSAWSELESYLFYISGREKKKRERIEGKEREKEDSEERSGAREWGEEGREKAGENVREEKLYLLTCCKISCTSFLQQSGLTLSDGICSEGHLQGFVLLLCASNTSFISLFRWTETCQAQMARMKHSVDKTITPQLQTCFEESPMLGDPHDDLFAKIISLAISLQFLVLMLQDQNRSSELPYRDGKNIPYLFLSQ